MRFTKIKSDDKNKYFVEENKIEEAVQKLAVFENMLDAFVKDTDDIPEQLAKLRKDGKDKTVAYKELVTKKLINTNILMFFKKHGININD